MRWSLPQKHSNKLGFTGRMNVEKNKVELHYTVDGNLFIKRVTLSCATIELLMMETLVSLVYFFFPALTRPEPPVYHWKIMRALMNGSSENTTVD